MMAAPELWLRHHVNGWTSAVSRNEDGEFWYGAHPQPGVTWYGEAPDLASAQQSADRAVPDHGCRCPAWSKTITPGRIDGQE